MKDLLKTINLVTRLHDGQYRKKSDIPYISHPFGVMTILLNQGFKSEDLLIIALLHDTLEDTKYTYEIMEKDYGTKIADYVELLSENKNLTWEERKKHTIKSIPRLPLKVKWVLLADKVNNLQMNQFELENNSLEWDKFNRGKDHQCWYYKSIYKALNVDENIRNHKLMEIFRELILDVFEGRVDEIPKLSI